MRYPLFIVVGVIGLLMAVPVLSLAGAEQSASQFQEFDATVGQTDQSKNSASQANGTNGPPAPPASTASTAGEKQTPPATKAAPSSTGDKKASKEQGLTLRSILSYLTPTQAEVDNALQELIHPRDRVNGRPGPHWEIRQK